MGAFGVVELQGAGERVEHRRRHPAEGAAFQLGVVLDADPGQGGDLAAAQPRDAALTDVGQAGLLRGDLGPPRGQELADLGSVVHAFDGTSFAGQRGMHCRYTFHQVTPTRAPAMRVTWRLATPAADNRAVQCHEYGRSCCHAWRSDVRPRRRAGRGPTRADHPEADRRDHQAVGDLHLRVGPVALPRHRPGRRADPDGPRVRRHRRRGRLARSPRSRPGQFVVGSFFASDNTCEICRAGYQTSCVNREILGTAGGAQAQRMRVPLADGTLVATPEVPPADLVPDFLAASDVLGHRAGSAPSPPKSGPARPSPWSATARSGCARVLAAQQLGAERIIAMSRHEARQQLAREFGATDIVTERGDEGVERIKELTDGLGAHSRHRGGRHPGSR